MSPERYLKVAQIFEAACERSAEELEAFVTHACAGDPSLRAEVDSLLASDRQATIQFRTPALGSAFDLCSVAPVEDDSMVGQRIGAYQLTRVVASGGMGIVYEARQQQPKRRVALKLTRAGVASDSSLQRARHEAEILGALHHPGIAQIFEAGTLETTGGSRPFFAMEFIAGEPLTDYARTSKLPLPARLELLAKVCDAVQHAHRKGVIHRDLKPNNILVDRSGQPKILDFGVARVTDADLQVTTLRTDVGQLIGTMAYMSPEQVTGDPQALDTRSDVYTLGLVLYELLCAKLPYDVTKTSLFHAAQIIREETPRRPSSIDRRLRGDVETITLKALEKDRHRRYQSATELAQDIRRYLGRRPIAARPPSWGYQVGMFARRHRTAFAGIVVAILALLGAVVFSTTFAIRAERAHAVADRQAYLANIIAADAALRVNDVAQARRRLEQAPVELRNWEWRHLLHRLDQSVRTFRGHEDPVGAVAFSPDGRRLASGSGGYLRLDCSLRLWDVATGEQIATLGEHGQPVSAVAFNHDGTRVAAVSDNSVVILWDVATGEQVLTLRGHAASVRAVAFGPSGTRIATGSADKTVKVWDAATGDELGTLRGHGGEVSAVGFSPDGSTLVSGSHDNTAKLWDWVAGRETATLAGHTNRVADVAFAPDGTRIATASLDGTVKVWRRLPAGEVTGSKPGSRLVEEILTFTGHGSDVLGVAFDPAGSRIASASVDNTVKVWDAATGEEIATLRGHTKRVYSAVFSPDGAWIATASDDHTVKLWDAASLEDVPTLRGHTQLVRAVAFNPDGTRIASASFDGTVKLWDVATRKEIATLDGHSGRVQCVAFSPDGTRVAMGPGEGMILLWDSQTGEQVATIHAYDPSVLGVTYSPDGTRLAAAGGRGTVQLWDAATGEALRTMRGHTGWAWCVAFSPDGTRLASASNDKTVRLWDAATGRELVTLRGHTSGVTWVAFSHDGTRLASSSFDTTVRIWNAKTGEEVATLTGHGGVVQSVAFSPDDTRLASASNDTTVKLWDTGTGEEVVTLRGHTHWVYSVAFSPDGARIASGGGSYEGLGCTVKLWDTDPGWAPDPGWGIMIRR